MASASLSGDNLEVFDKLLSVTNRFYGVKIFVVSKYGDLIFSIYKLSLEF